MPGLYRANPTVTDSTGKAGRAGLALPFTPTIGSIRFKQDHRDYLESPMVEDFFSGKIPWEGDASKLPGGGIKSYAMDNCVVVCVVQLNGAIGNGSSWGQGFFAHLPGGNWNMCDLGVKFDRFARYVDKSKCYSLVMANFDGGLGNTLERVFKNGFSKEQMSIYISNIRTIGVAVEFRNMGEFGEITWNDSRDHKGPYGVVDEDPRRYFNC